MNGSRHLASCLALSLALSLAACGAGGAGADADAPADVGAPGDGGAPDLAPPPADGAGSDLAPRPDGGPGPDAGADGPGPQDVPPAADVPQDQTAAADTPDVGAGGDLEVTRAVIGSPTWTVEDVAIFGGLCGVETIDPAIETVQAILPDHAFYPDQAVFGPRDPHDPPYDHEISDGLARLGIPGGPYRTHDDVVAPMCVFILMMLVPSDGAPVGASPDFVSGPLLDPAGFPLHVDGDLYQGTQLVDLNFDSDFPGLDALTPPVAGDGYSHAVLTFAENTWWGPAQMPVGDYALELRITEADGDGWEVRVPFSIGPPTGPCATAEAVLHPEGVCPANQTCSPDGYCRDAGATPLGNVCNFDTDCGPAALCTRHPSGGTSACRTLCASPGGTCAGADEACLPVGSVVEGLGACLPPPPAVEDCNPLTSEPCREPDACYGLPMGPACLPPGATPLGSACTAPEQCVPGATCYGPEPEPMQCRHWCWATECDAGQTCADHGHVSTGMPFGVCL